MEQMPDFHLIDSFRNNLVIVLPLLLLLLGLIVLYYVALARAVCIAASSVSALGMMLGTVKR